MRSRKEAVWSIKRPRSRKETAVEERGRAVEERGCTKKASVKKRGRMVEETGRTVDKEAARSIKRARNGYGGRGR